MQILTVSAPSPYRIRLSANSALTTTPSDYVISRQDNGAVTITVTNVWSTGTNAVEMSTSDALSNDFVYVVTLPNASGTPSAVLGYRTPQSITTLPAVDDDPEAEALGVDIDWLAPALDPAGDSPKIRGRACLINDLAAAALTTPGELFHKPTDGGGMRLKVNGPAIPGQLSGIRASLLRQWTKDPRVRQGGVAIDVSSSSDGKVSVLGTIQPIAIEDPLTVQPTTGSA